MTPLEYQRLAARTECDQSRSRERIISRDSITLADALGPTRLIHAALGLVGEAGEFAYAIEKVLYYGQPSDGVNMKEELGDCLWYIALACNALGITIEELMESNIAKLHNRFPEKYTDWHAAEENRDRDREKNTIEKVRTAATGITANEAAQLIRQNTYLCPNCKYIVNDETARRLMLGGRGCCPECKTFFNWDEIKDNAKP